MAKSTGTKPAHWTEEDWQAALELCRFIRRVKAKRRGVAGIETTEHEQ